MSRSTLDRLADADPARELHPDPPDDLLARTLALPRTAPRQPRRRPLRLAVAATAVAAIAAVTVLTLPQGHDARALAAQAYDQLRPGPGEILHTIVTSTTIFEPDPGKPVVTMDGPLRTEEWQRGREIRQEQTFQNPGEPPMAVSRTIDADGVMRTINEEGRYRVIRPGDSEDAAQVIADDQLGFVERFRRSYERGTLDPAGDVTFAGRPARRFVVAPTPGGTTTPDGTEQMPMPPEPRMEYFVDRETGAPLGSISALRSGVAAGPTRTSTGTLRFVQTVERVERLAPTPALLALLHDVRSPVRR